MSKRTLIALCFAAAVATTAWSRPARAELPALAGSVHGGEVSTTQRGAITLGLGWPSFFFQYDFHTSGRFGIGLRSDLFWGNPAFGFGTGFGWGASAPMRIQVLDRNDWFLSVLIDPGLWMGFGNHWYYDWDRNYAGFIFGPRIGTGLVASIAPVDFLNIFFGLRFYLNILVFTPDAGDTWADVVAQILPYFGLELSVHRSIALFFQVMGGPSIGSTGEYCVRRDPDPPHDCIDWGRHIWANGYFSGYFGVTFYLGS
jgi:hypothetical protein